MLTELINKVEINDFVISERMKVYEASFNFDISNAPDYKYFSDIIKFVDAFYNSRDEFDEFEVGENVIKDILNPLDRS